MKTFVLVGEQAVSRFNNGDWKQFEECILQDFDGDIISWSKETDEVSELLQQLQGWDNFIELSEQDLKELKLILKLKYYGNIRYF